MFNRMTSIKNKKSKALSIFEDAKKKMTDVVADLYEEIGGANNRISKLKQDMVTENALISEAKLEIASAQQTIDKIDQILGK